MNVIEKLIAQGVIIVRQKCVHVRKYVRIRLGNKEYVREHWRSLPYRKCQIR